MGRLCAIRRDPPVSAKDIKGSTPIRPGGRKGGHMAPNQSSCCLPALVHFDRDQRVGKDRRRIAPG